MQPRRGTSLLKTGNPEAVGKKTVRPDYVNFHCFYQQIGRQTTDWGSTYRMTHRQRPREGKGSRAGSQPLARGGRHDSCLT